MSAVDPDPRSRDRREVAREGLLETLEILADTEMVESLAHGLKDAEAGRLVEHDELWDAL